jgi:hypothetical protein
MAKKRLPKKPKRRIPVPKPTKIELAKKNYRRVWEKPKIRKEIGDVEWNN